ncbi:MAG: GNAT family N-acetyltransferase [bacterium]|nr:GNAT family N-acetyltransferase [bacterium]
MTPDSAFKVRPTKLSDLPAVVELDGLVSGEQKVMYWREVFAHYLKDSSCVALVVEGIFGVEGFLFGEVRAFEFGSPEFGWVVSIEVHPSSRRKGRGSALLKQARECFGTLGVTSLRTMAARTNVPTLSLFRSHGFVGGPFVQLELNLDDSEE